MSEEEIKMFIHVTNLRVKRAKDYVDNARRSLAEFIRDKSIPLEERWKIFSESPAYLFEHSPYIVHIGSFEGLGFGIGYDAEIHAEKHKEVDLAERFNDIWYEDDEDELLLTQEQWDAIREEILEKGYRTFTFDW